MRRWLRGYRIFGRWAAGGVLLLWVHQALGQGPALPPVHGLLAAPGSGEQLLLATHGGLYRAGADGADPVPGPPGDYLALAGPVGKPGSLYISALTPQGWQLLHLAPGESFLREQPVEDGPSGPLIHLLLSPDTPALLLGAREVLWVSRDAGRRWQRQGPLPGKVASLALSAGKAPRVYAAAPSGIYVSEDLGQRWTRLAQEPATTVALTPAGDLVAYLVGRGLVRYQPLSKQWLTLSNVLGAQLPVQLAFSQQNPKRWYALTQFGRLLTSDDGGSSWQRFRDTPVSRTEAERRGEQLYGRLCQGCHGRQGVGESFTAEALAEVTYIFAPPLDDSAHAWYHSDAQLVESILHGSALKSRMPAWALQAEGNRRLNRRQADDLVAYIKTLWGARALRCQGPDYRECLAEKKAPDTSP